MLPGTAADRPVDRPRARSTLSWGTLGDTAAGAAAARRSCARYVDGRAHSERQAPRRRASQARSPRIDAISQLADSRSCIEPSAQPKLSPAQRRATHNRHVCLRGRRGAPVARLSSTDLNWLLVVGGPGRGKTGLCGARCISRRTVAPSPLYTPTLAIAAGHRPDSPSAAPVPMERGHT